MDMLKQMRVRFSGIGEEEKGGSTSSSTIERRIPPRKTQPFKETKRAPSWLERQFIRTMSRDYDSSDSVDYPAAVAAAAYAVKSIEEKDNNDHRRTNSGGDRPLTKIKSKADDIPKKPEKLSGEVSKPSPKLPDRNVTIRTTTINQEPVNNTVPSIKKKPTFGDTKPENEVADQKAKGHAPSMKKTSTFADQSIDIKAPKTPVSKAAVVPTKQSPFQPDIAKVPNTMKPESGYSKADIWEKEEMEKIRERYKKLNKEIVEWETKKKKKAKNHLEKIEAELLANKNMKLQAELDRRREKAMRHFNNEVERTESIAEGAKAQAQQNRHNEELKAKEKANKIRSTGKMPPTCLCF